jgi:hypothetical protein
VTSSGRIGNFRQAFNHIGLFNAAEATAQPLEWVANTGRWPPPLLAGRKKQWS